MLQYFRHNSNDHILAKIDDVSKREGSKLGIHLPIDVLVAVEEMDSSRLGPR